MFPELRLDLLYIFPVDEQHLRDFDAGHLDKVPYEKECRQAVGDDARHRRTVAAVERNQDQIGHDVCGHADDQEHEVLLLLALYNVVGTDHLIVDHEDNTDENNHRDQISGGILASEKQIDKRLSEGDDSEDDEDTRGIADADDEADLVMILPLGKLGDHDLFQRIRDQPDALGEHDADGINADFRARDELLEHDYVDTVIER